MDSKTQAVAQYRASNALRVAAAIGIILGIIGVLKWGPISRELLLAPGLMITSFLTSYLTTDWMLQLAAVVLNGAVFGAIGYLLVYLWATVNLERNQKFIAIGLALLVSIPLVYSYTDPSQQRLPTH
jgi:hypothetical protein